MLVPTLTRSRILPTTVRLAASYSEASGGRTSHPRKPRGDRRGEWSSRRNLRIERYDDGLGNERIDRYERTERYNGGNRLERGNALGAPGEFAPLPLEPKAYRAPGVVARTKPPQHLMTLADRSAKEISTLVRSALASKLLFKKYGTQPLRKSLNNRSVALLFSKRSTRTRVASETSVAMLGGHAMFLGSADIQLGVNETLEDSARVIGSMTDGIMARVGEHREVTTLAEYSPVPVVNALSDLYHPTQILADLLTLVETYNPGLELPDFDLRDRPHNAIRNWVDENVDVEETLKGKKVAWVGDTNNIINEILVTMPRFGMEVGVAAPQGYDKVDPRVWDRVKEQGTESLISFTNTPAEALKDADVVVTDTWISMGQEEETAARLKSFEGYQLTNALIDGSGANPEWKFMHCLPRHKDEVDDEVFYGPRSLVFPEAENRKWTIMAVFDALMGRWTRV